MDHPLINSKTKREPNAEISKYILLKKGNGIIKPNPICFTIYVRIQVNFLISRNANENEFDK